MRYSWGLISLAAITSLAGTAAGRLPGLPVPDPVLVGPATPISADVPRVRERSGRLLVRPMQESEWIAHGRTPGDAALLSQDARSRLDAMRIGIIDPIDVHIVAVPCGESEDVLAAALMATGVYQYVEPDWIVYPCDTYSDDPGLAVQWHLGQMEATAAWDTTTGDGSVVCAFVDTGVDLTHPDLAPNLVSGYNSASHLSQALGGVVNDINGHGTSVAGAAAAIGNNAEGGCGVGWDLRVMPIRASNLASGAAYMSDLLYGAIWAAANGARVVSVSYSGVENISVEATGLAIKQQYNGLLFWAAGNSNAPLNFHWPDAMVVGATDQNDVKSAESNWGPAIDVVAPGVAIYAPQRGGGYGLVDGTSFSTPLAAATAGLLWSAAPNLSPDQVSSILQQSADDLGAPGRDDLYGNGRINVRRAIELVRPGSSTEPGTDLLPAIQGEAEGPGVVTSYYLLPTGPVILPNSGAPPLARTVAPTLDFRIGPGGRMPGCPLFSWFVAIFDGVVIVPVGGVYTFTLESSESSALRIDGRRIVDNSGVHPDRTRSGSIGLQAGAHRLRCTAAVLTQTPTIVLGVRGEGLGQHTVPAPMLGHPVLIAR